MAEGERVQFLDWVIAVVTAAIVILALSPARLLLEPSGADVANHAIKDSAAWPVMLWCLGWPIAVLPRQAAPAARITWTVGCLTCLVHIALAFHLGHAWSHEAAWEHTRQVGGSGDGVFVNYAFALVWLADVVWTWASPSSYFARPRWLNWTVHGFLAFVVFNAAVVFGSWESRFAFVGFFAVSVFGVWYARRRTTTPARSASKGQP